MSKKQTAPGYEGFTLALALVDAVPVLLFGASCVLVGIIFKSPLFVAGAAFCFLGGLLKVLWKVFLAVSKKDVSFLSKQFRCTMPLGFVLILVSVIVNLKRISLKAIWAGVTRMPSVIFFALGLAGMAAMGALAGKLDQKRARSNWIEQCTNGFAQLCIFLGLLFLL